MIIKTSSTVSFGKRCNVLIEVLKNTNCTAQFVNKVDTVEHVQNLSLTEYNINASVSMPSLDSLKQRETALFVQ